MICTLLYFVDDANANAICFDVLQMALWQQQTGKLFLPPAKPVAKILSTDDYVIGTQLHFHAGTDRLLTVGHPYYEIRNDGDPNKVEIPKVSACQYRVFRLKLPDPNKFALIDQSIFNPERERLVWKLKGIQIGRGGPLNVGTAGHPLFNKAPDTENPNDYPPAQTDEDRRNVSMDPKHTQLFIIGCTPADGEYWDVAKPCVGDQANAGDCPPIQLVNAVIQDGTMGDTGFGAANFKNFLQDKAGVPLDIINDICMYPDFLKMDKDVYGDKCFFFGKREQSYARHFMAREGKMGDAIPEGNKYLLPPTNAVNFKMGSHVYFPTASGSLTTSDSNLFNRPYWLQRSLGANNGICWGNQLFVTVLDNSRNTNFTLSIYNQGGAIGNQYTYKSQDFTQYTRHAEEYELEGIFQLCRVPLEPDILAHLNVMNPNILDEWQLAFVPPPPQSIEDNYRYITSLATRCPTENPAPEIPDPYKDYNFWLVDLQEKFSSELDQFSLGRKFLFQSGLLPTKRVRTVANSSVRNTSRTVKRKRTR